MIKRETYMQRIRPFINTELIKVFTGIRRSGKSVMLELVKDELKNSGVSENNFLCINFEQFSQSELLEDKKIVSVNEKYYCADHGLREAVFGKNMQNIDQVLENIVCLELLRRNYKVYVGKKDDLEIDFIAEKQGKKIYVQVAYLLAGEETVKRKFSVYNSVKDSYPKYVVSTDAIAFSQNGIIHKNIKDFLLEDF